MRWRTSTLLCALTLAACSGADQTTTITVPATTTTTTAPTTGAAAEGTTMQLSSPAFEHEGAIPARFTCDGDDVSPALEIADIPAGTVAMALIVDDPDAPRGTWDHWVAYDIAPAPTIPEDVGPIGTAGVGTGGNTDYSGPCPPSGMHRYYFTVLALDQELGLPRGATKADVQAAAAGHVLAEAVLMGTYTR
jgi:Raf kinase inhibitor-like YbhB/YbcL family protein